MAGTTECGKFRFESFDFRSQNELTVVQDTGDRGIDRGPEAAALCSNVNKRDGRKVHAQIHRDVRRLCPLTDDGTRPFSLRRCGRRTMGQTARCDLKACHRLLSCHGGRGACTNSAQKCEKLRAKRLRVPHRQMAHRVAAVRLEAEAFRHLSRQQIAGDIFAARRDGYVARFERRQPIRVDVRKHP